MNKRGQTLILFVILIPIIIMVLAIVVDIGLIASRKIKLEEITKDAIKDCYYLDNDRVIEFFKKNDIETDNIKINRDNDILYIEIKEEVKSIFGGIIGIKKYDIKVNIKGYIKDGKINFE